MMKEEKSCEEKKNVPAKTVEIGDGDALKEGDDEQWNIAAKVVKQGEDIVASPMNEDHRQDAA